MSTAINESTYNALEVEYQTWVIKNFIDHKHYDWGRYRNLLTNLWSISFVSKHPMDINRMVDGNTLKVRFGQDAGKDISDRYFREWLNFSITSVLDVMVALALRTFEEITGDFPDPIPPSDIFWMMIENMHLENEDDNDFHQDEVIRRVENMMYRRYDSDGDGGLFRIKGTTHNMREAEIWYQMQWWAVSVFEWYKKKGDTDARLPNCINSND